MHLCYPSRLLILMTWLFCGFSGPVVLAQSALAANLTHEEAKQRKVLLQAVDYQLSIILGEENEAFEGKTQVSFQINQPRATFLDFHGGEIKSLVINQKKLAKPEYDGKRIILPQQYLKKGANQVLVHYSRAYSRTGAGLYRFKDPEDGKVYLFTQFQPFDANQLFPSFDQPDLKASYMMDVVAPKDWQVITASRESQIKSLSDDKKQWYFPQTDRFSTYIFSLHAGPYVKWEDQAGSVPLRLFARQSLAAYVEPKDWFPVTKQGFEFFDKYFEFPYPFHKYDQIIVPDFNAGAMENVASVTFSERFIKRRAATYEERRGLANTILHELAHMWFGNLVTMEWWNDLWLNESFATYMAHLALVEATEFEDSWQSFLRTTKTWAYWTDQLDTTHPIEADVPDTIRAFSNFDGITYGKGASFLKLLQFYMGEENFQKGLALYFKTHAFKTTTREDFIQALSTAHQGSLETFANEWLQTAGVNKITAEAICEKNTLKSIHIHQTATADQATLRSHASKIALLSEGPKRSLKLSQVIEARYQGAKTEIAVADGSACPQLVYPNFEDHDYVLVNLGADGEKWQQSIGRIEDPFLRLMIWRDLWESVINADLSAFVFADLVTKQLAQEADYHIQSLLIRNLPNLKTYLYKASQRSELAQEANQKSQKLMNLVWQKLNDQKTSDQLRLSWLETYLSFALDKDSIKRIQDLYDDKIVIAGLTIDQDMKWELLKKLSALADPSVDTRLQKAVAADKSIRGERNAMAVDILQPKQDTKRIWIDKALDSQAGLSVAERRVILGAVFPVNQDDLRLQFADSYFGLFPEITGKFPPNIAAGIIQALAPVNCTAKESKRLRTFMEKQKDLSLAVEKNLKNLLQEDERCQAVLQRLMPNKV